MEDEQQKENIQWHPAFCSATELELREDKDNLEFESEHQLSSSPLKIDLMVIKKKPGVKTKNEIGHIFMTHNIIEYKCPDDYFNIDNYYKSLAYVCLYKSLGETVNAIPIEELTLSLFHDSKPVKLMKILEETGHRIIEKYKGIYYVEGNITVPRQQIIVTEEFDNGHCFLKALSKKFTVEDGMELVEYAETAKSEGDKHNLYSVLQVSFLANNSIYDFLDWGKNMRSAFDSFCEIFKDKIDAKIAAKVAAAEAILRKEADDRIKEADDRIKEADDRAKKTEARVKALEKEIEELRKKILN